MGLAAAEPGRVQRLKDSPTRDYSAKLRLFNAFAEREIRAAIAGLALVPGMRVLDAGCGTGDALLWFRSEVGPHGLVIGFDLSAAHALSAAAVLPEAHGSVLQADLLHAPFADANFDLIWCANTIHHLSEPVTAVRSLMRLLRPGGRIALGQSSLVADMYFAWDARLERVTNEAVRQYYRDRYGLDEHDLAAVRSLVGVLRGAALHDVSVRTWMIERIAPLAAADEAYLQQAIFRDTWGERLRPYLSAEDYAELARLCDPQDPGYALRRPDFHFLQSFTLATGRLER